MASFPYFNGTGSVERNNEARAHIANMENLQQNIGGYRDVFYSVRHTDEFVTTEQCI